jgi:CubicO group peptidase (beta-lactamase class C family)
VNVPGKVVATSVNGVREYRAEGFRSTLDLDSPLPMEIDTSFDLASLTKIIATVGTLMAVESQWSLDDFVGKYLPTWGSGDKSAVTLRHLLQHRSGLAPWLPLYIRHSNPESAHDLIAKNPLESKVDEVRKYSDLGFIALGKILEVITGEKFEDAVKRYVLTPLGMTQTQFASPMTEAASTSRGDRFEYEMVRSGVPYKVDEKVEDFSGWRNRILTGEVNDGNAFHLFGGISSHAGLFSTAADVLTFCENITPSVTFQRFISESRDDGFHIGFKSWADTCGDCSVRFYGHTGFTGTALAISPDHNASVVMLTNRLHTDGEVAPTENLIQAEIKAFHAKLHATKTL